MCYLEIGKTGVDVGAGRAWGGGAVTKDGWGVGKKGRGLGGMSGKGRRRVGVGGVAARGENGWGQRRGEKKGGGKACPVTLRVVHEVHELRRFTNTIPY